MQSGLGVGVGFILVEHVLNVMAHAQNPDLVFQRNGRVHLNRRGSQFSRLLAVEECGSAGRPWIDRVPRHSARAVATLSNRLFPLHFPSHASPCAITFRTASTWLLPLQHHSIIVPHAFMNSFFLFTAFLHLSQSRTSVHFPLFHSCNMLSPSNPKRQSHPSNM